MFPINGQMKLIFLSAEKELDMMKYFKICLAMLIIAVMASIPSVVQAVVVELSWQRPKTPPDFVGYKIYWGAQSGDYTQHVDVDAQQTSVVIPNLEPGTTYYFAATTINQSGYESTFSNEIELPLLEDAATDTDRDGISDRDERNIYGTDPKQADSDGDGIDDGDEMTFWGAAWNGDVDGDGLINLLDHDADNDGVADAAEIDANTNPADDTSTPDIQSPDLMLLPIAAVQASDSQKPHTASQAIDGELDTHWAAEGDGQSIRYDLGSAAAVAEVAIAWGLGDQYATAFTLETSIDGTVWQEAWSGDSSGTTLEPEVYTFTSRPARYVRIVGYGNTTDRWNRVAETEIYGQPTRMPLPIQSVKASVNRSNPPSNTLDGDLSTHWSAKGDGQWIQYDVGTTAMISEVAIAWAQGDRRTASFALHVSSDGNSWTEVFSGDSSGTTRKLETYTFPEVAARYVLIIGYGNSSNLWNLIAETEIRGHVVDRTAIEEKTVGGQTYTVQLIAWDDFSNLDNWLFETPDPATAMVSDRTLHWDARDTVGTLWQRTEMSGPTIVEYDVQAIEGKLNINGIFYGSLIKQRQETLLEAKRNGNAAPITYCQFQNYTVTFTDPDNDGGWRTRFRKNPGHKLLVERWKKHDISPDSYHRMTYVFEANGRMSLYVDGVRKHQYTDKKRPYRRGYHALKFIKRCQTIETSRFIAFFPATASSHRSGYSSIRHESRGRDAIFTPKPHATEAI